MLRPFDRVNEQVLNHSTGSTLWVSLPLNWQFAPKGRPMMKLLDTSYFSKSFVKKEGKGTKDEPSLF